MVTVEVDPVGVESRLAAGAIVCPACRGGVLGGWGYGRARQVEGLTDLLRPRRARCRGCMVTHVLLPVTVFLRRSYAAERVWAALNARGEGAGHRRIGLGLGVPAATVRGWLRRAASRLEQMRVWFVMVAVGIGVDVQIPDATGCAWRDLLNAVAAATEAIKARFGGVGLGATVTAEAVAVAVSGGRLLAPGWPPLAGGGFATPLVPAAGRDIR